MEKVRTNRPFLRHQSPFVFFMAWGYAGTNLLIGLGIYHTPALPYAFTRGAFGPHFWGIIFMLMGVFGTIFLLLNFWTGIRRVLMFGLAVKALFFYGLLLRISWDELAILGIWALISYAQFLTIVFFPQEIGNGANRS